MSKKNIREHWNIDALAYQKREKLSTEYVLYGPHCPTEDDLNLLGDVRGKEVIELGCGGAQHSIALAKKGANCTGIDLSEEQLKFAKKLIEENKVKVKLILGDIENLDMIEDNLFDTAFSAFALDWVQDLDKVFQEAYRILNDAGIFVFSMGHPFYNCLGNYPNPRDLKIKLGYFQRNILEKDDNSGITMNFVLPTISDIINSLINTGFVIEKIVEPEPVEDKFMDGTSHDYYPVEILKTVPATIIIKVKKK
ncbi:2-methoxy-6-polyprenyl-1,4-benzoquinol methylase, mitochondrial [subsurface metagenome]